MKWYRCEHFVCSLCGYLWAELNKGQLVLCPNCGNVASRLTPQITYHWPHLSYTWKGEEDA